MLKTNKQCNISNKTNPQKAINLLSASAYLEGSFVNWKQKHTKLKIEFNGIYFYPGCQRLFMRGFRFRSSLYALWPARKAFSGARDIGPVAPKQLIGKKPRYPGYLRANLFIQSGTPSFTPMQKQPKKKFKGKKSSHAQAHPPPLRCLIWKETSGIHFTNSLRL